MTKGYAFSIPSVTRAGLAVLGLCAYLLFFWLAFPVFGSEIDPVSGLWVVLAGGLLGWRAGLFAGLLNFPLHLLLFSAVGEDAVSHTFYEPGMYTRLLLGMIAGWMGDLLRLTRAQTRELKESESRYRQLVDLVPVGIVVHESGMITFSNPEAAKVAGVASPQELLGRSVMDFVAPESRALVIERMKASQQDTRHLELTIEHFLREDGSTATAEVAALRLPSTRQDLTMVVFRDVSDRAKLEAELAYRAYHDALTDLPNRSRFLEEANRALALAHREAWSVAVLFLDLDRFKEVNDAIGHAAGDRLLQSVTARLRETVREGDLLARLGGDEFALLLQNCNTEGAAQSGQRLVESLKEPFYLTDTPLYLSVSVGIALYPQDGGSVDELVALADAAMYRAKARGNGIAFISDDKTRYTQERLQLEADLRRALADEALVLHYQPIQEVTSGRWVGVEALARWSHPNQGMVSPAEFVALAEQRGLSLELDRYVLGRALKEAASLPGWVAVNLSPESFLDPCLVGFIRDTAAVHGVEPARLVVEITERILAEPVQAQQTLAELRALGVRVAVDDFGTGYSSLAYLRNLPLDHLKVDRSFIKGLGAHAEDAAIVQAVLALATSLGLEVVAEGVETHEQLAWLSLNGCALVQGYLLGKPMPLPELQASFKKP